MDHYGLTLISGPAGEPITADEAKAYARVDHDDEDSLWQIWVEKARQDCERVTGRQLLTATWRLALDGWPCDGVIRLPLPPLQSVTSIKYDDSSDVEQTIAATDYVVDTASEPGRITVIDGESWPTDLRDEPGCIRIVFVCGYGEAADVPAGARMRLLQAAAYLNEHRAEADPSFSDRLFYSLWAGTYV